MVKENFSEEKNQIVFVPAGMGDIDRLIELESKLTGLKTYSPALTEDDWKEEFDKSIVLLLMQKEVLVGDLAYKVISEDEIYISGLAIDPKFQGMGYGKQAVQKVLDDNRHICKFYLVTHPESPAVRLYKSFGFIQKEKYENYFGDGEPRIKMEMLRDLNIK